MVTTVPTVRQLQLLKARLLALGGVKFQFDWVLREQLSAQQVTALLRDGESFSGSTARLVRGGQVNGCHENTAAFVAKNPAWFNFFGLALSGGIWRIHSWAVYTDGPRISRIAETTVLMERYFGVPIAGGSGIPTLAASAVAGHPPAIDRS
jgi:hypothetical protein